MIYILETSKNFRGHQQDLKKSKKAEKRGRFHHKANNQNHHRKKQDFLKLTPDAFYMHNKFH